jgi:HSP20 family protein
MNIVKYDPFRELRSLHDELSRVFVDPFTGSGEEITRGVWSPSVDVFENDDKIVLEAELPGMKADEVDVSIENNVVTIKGERKFEKKEEKDNYHRIERSYGSFTRSFTLPRTVTGDEASADFENGVLKITLPKREEARARKIEISGKRQTGEQANSASA